jgi:hypothetical protein
MQIFWKLLHKMHWRRLNHMKLFCLQMKCKFRVDNGKKLYKWLIKCNVFRIIAYYTLQSANYITCNNKFRLSSFQTWKIYKYRNIIFYLLIRTVLLTSYQDLRVSLILHSKASFITKPAHSKWDSVWWQYHYGLVCHPRRNSSRIVWEDYFIKLNPVMSIRCWSPWPLVLTGRSTADRLMRSWFRIPPAAWMFACFVCCVLSG